VMEQQSAGPIKIPIHPRKKFSEASSQKPGAKSRFYVPS
jgi:hypothetical protein